MIRNRSTRVLATLGVVSLALGALVGPAAVLAAPPNWSMDVVELPDTVSPGNLAGYQVTITNGGPSNVSQLYLTTSTDNDPATAYVAGTGCDPVGEPLFCRLGQLKKGKSVTVIVAYQTPETGATFSLTFEGNTTGASDEDGGTSHGDTVMKTASTDLNPDATNFSGEFLLTPGVVENGQSLTTDNPQTVSVNVPLAHVPATVEDGPGVEPGPCPTGETCAGWAELHVNSGLPTNFTAFMQFDSSLGLPNANSIEFGHIPDVGPAEDIAGCTFRPNNPAPTNIPCFTATNIGGGDVAATFYLDENGKIFGH